ncbi:hypothetical protein F441_14868 [Phytophthora nicotianae CJ01A1]|uniref:FAD-binding FR-type domain-containing protein n=1 Tax=Phytophthora nicotianae CJ01A1 TaxID=1317063 RepID=W2WFY0_PHYNI|nr:hypothetical protein F441_14868 [Phytophthora nicotianae CJ01A1]
MSAERFANPYLIPDRIEPEVETAPRLRQRRHSSSLWRYALVTTLNLFVALCFVLFIGGQAAYVSPLYKNHLQSLVASWWGSHEEMVDPSYLLLVGVAPTLLCVAVAQWLYRLRTQRKIWRITTILRRRPSPDSLSYGELLFLFVLSTGNALVFWYGFTKKHGHKPRFSGDPPSPHPPHPPGPPSGTSYIKMAGNALGFNCLFNMGLLFIPATRNNIWMEFMNISYANGIKFHRWLGVAAILTGIIHCGCYYYNWLQDGRWKQMTLPCWDCSLRERTGRKIWVNVFGELALLCFLVIGVTSIPWIRRKMYNFFYNVHQLFFLAILFTTLHWSRAVWFLLPSVVVYLVSRVLSHCNGASSVKVVEFTALSPSLCKLVIAHTPSERGRYQVGQFVYLNVPAISRLEWHAFTIASSPKTSYKSSNTMTILIKALGDWTEKLVVYQQVCTRCSIEPEVYVDGYYGVSLEMYKSYSTVVLIGGGVGISPLLGLLEGICITAETRQVHGRKSFPRRVAAIFTMRELELLKEIYPLLVRLREVDPQGRFISVTVTLTTTPRPDELDASLDGDYKCSGFLPTYSFSQIQIFSHSTKKGCPFGSSLGPSGISMLHFIAFGLVVGLVTVFQLGNGMLVGLQDIIWVLQLSLKTFALFAAAFCVYICVVVMRWIGIIRAAYKTVRTQYPVDEWSLKENLLPESRGRIFNPDILTFRDLIGDFHVRVGNRPDLTKHLRKLHAGHRQRCSGAGAIGVFVSGPGSLKTSIAKAAASIGASDFDIHEEEFEL